MNIHRVLSNTSRGSAASQKNKTISGTLSRKVLHAHACK